MRERDENLIKICNDIYNKHRVALRLIFENVKTDNSADSEIICGELKNLADEGKIVYRGNNGRWFTTERMDSFLPPLDTPDSSWKSTNVYSYWIEKSEDALIMHLELSGSNLTDMHKVHMNALITAANKKVDEFTFKRIYYKKVSLNQDDYEDSLKNAVRTLVLAAIKNEDELMKSVTALLSE